MNGWQLATDASIWILILGSIAVFGWFLVEVVRLARTRRATSRHADGPRASDAATGEAAPGEDAPGADGPGAPRDQ